MIFCTKIRSCVVMWFALSVVGFNLTGCAVLKRFPHNYTCPPNQDSQCNENCEPGCNHEHAHSGEEYIPSQLQEALPGDWEELSKVQGQLDVLMEKDTSLQEQLAMLDQNAEKQRLAGEEHLQEMRELASQMSTMQREIEVQKSELEQVETTLLDQRDKNEQILASVEKQLVDVLQEYQ